MLSAFKIIFHLSLFYPDPSALLVIEISIFPTLILEIEVNTSKNSSNLYKSYYT